MIFEIIVRRIETREHMFKVGAEDEQVAVQAALMAARDFDFSNGASCEAEYEIAGIVVRKRKTGLRTAEALA